MTWFVLLSPGTFLLIMAVYTLGSLVWVVWEMIEDADAERERRYRNAHPRTAADIFPGFKISEPGSCPEFQQLLKRLAASRK